MSEAAPLDARTRRLGSAFDLMAAYDAASGFFMERAGLGVAGRGASMRVVVPGGPDQAARAASATAAALAVVRRGERISSSARRAHLFVELIGIEPTTSGLQSQRSPN